MTLKHVIFDCDGVLVDSEPLSMRADVTLLRRFGIQMSEDLAHRKFVGKTFQAMLDMMTAEHGVTFPPDTSAQKDAAVETLYRAELKIVDGVFDLLTHLKQRGLTISIGSNSPRKRVALAIELTGIAHFFDRIVSYEDVKQGKPSPDIFIKAAQLAGEAIGHCLVIEDSITGVTAAVAAGIRTIGFTGTHHDPEGHAFKLIDAGASHTVQHMRDVIGLL
jgi:HAD superfamily hydrolase (TIGR01509 family)